MSNWDFVRKLFVACCVDLVVYALMREHESKAASEFISFVAYFGTVAAQIGKRCD